VLDQLRREGVTIRADVKVSRARRAGDAVELVVTGESGEETIAGSHVLIATGRQPTVDGLDLEAAGIKYERGGIKVNRQLKTSNRRVFAIGDVTGQIALTHAANYHAGVVIRNALFRWPAKVHESAIPWVTYTEPELAQTGLTEAQARARRYKLRILRWPYHDNDRGQTERATRGHIKVVTDKRGRILGATIVGAQAGELITAWSLAIAQKLNVRAMTGVVVPYPTLSEVGKRAAIEFFTPGLTSPWVRRIIAMLRVFG
jgi:pyruvate/2-oxoglutarate dehydrogenase complex dihydrolipoamide dehydrogenase (E3) component